MALDQVDAETRAETNRTVIETLANWAANAGPYWPELALERAGHAIEDTVACMIAGAADDATSGARRAIADWGTGGATVVGREAPGSAPAAALVNGTAAHALDFDDNFLAAATHASAVLVPALLAMAEGVGASGRQMIDAFIVGTELHAAIGRGVNRSHYNAGWHPTATVGAIGTAGACARLLGLDAGGTAHAMSLGVSMACGNKAQFGSMAKPLQAGLAAQHAVMAADLAAAGLEGRMEVLEGPMGFLELFGGRFAEGWTKALAKLGNPLALIEIGLWPKRHPCCGSAHRAMDALLDLRQAHGFAAADVASIHVLVGDTNKKNLAYERPTNEREAKFSMQYCLALALLQDRIRMADFSDEAVAREDVGALVPLTTMTSFPAEREQKAEQGLAHDLTVRLKDGRKFEVSRVYPRGAIQDPFDDADRRAKFEDCVAAHPDPLAAERLRHELTRLGSVTDVRDFLAHMRFAA